jgi:sulfatase maturation enzyme AslB (radical SAM superfamily)
MVRRQWLSERPPLGGEGQQDDLAGGELPEEIRRVWEALRRLGVPQGWKVTLERSHREALAFRVEEGPVLLLRLCAEQPRPGRRYLKQSEALGVWYAGLRALDGEGLRRVRAWMPGAVGVVLAGGAALAARLKEGQETAAREEPPGPSGGAEEARDKGPYARLRVLGPADVERFFHVDYEYEPGADVGHPATTRIGVIYQCNQPCTFCQLAEMNTHIPPPRIYAALDASRQRGAQRVIFTGGEPTMCKELEAYVAHARAQGYSTIEMQSNATLLDRGDLARRLREAGLTDCQVSLHGPDSEISDRLTAAPGTHQRTLRGVSNLLDQGVRVFLNHLIFRDNFRLMPAFVEMVERLWGRHRELLNLQFHAPLNEFARAEQAHQHIARYTDYAPLLKEAIDRARSLGYQVRDLQDPTGIPALCVLGPDSPYLGEVLSQKTRPRFHRWESRWLTRVAACSSCDVATLCMGVPTAYVALHGDGEFKPIRQPR